VFTHLLVVVAASDMGPRCRWQGGGVGHSSLLVLFMGGVLSSVLYSAPPIPAGIHRNGTSKVQHSGYSPNGIW